MRRVCLCMMCLFLAAPAGAQNYSFYKRMNCPDIGVKTKPISPKELDALRFMFQNTPNNFMTKCHYENGAYLSAFWSEDFPAKNELCQTPWYKKMNSRRAPYTFEGDNQPYRVGLGVELQKKNAHDEVAEVIGVIADSGAQAAGLVSGDKIVSVNKTIIKGLNLLETVDLTKGRMNEEIKLGVISQGSKRKRIKKVKIGQYAPPRASFSVASPSHFIHVSGEFLNNPETFDRDLVLWKEKAIELSQSIESLAVQCRGYNVSEKGPVAQ